MKIGIIGGGTVGRATARCFMEHAEVRVFDEVKEKGTHDLAEVMMCDLIFICLPTPQREGELSCDIQPLVKFFENPVVGFQYDLKTANLVLRSTVPVGTTRRFSEKYSLPNLVHSPEFLTARCALTDAMIPARNIVGLLKMEKPSSCGEALVDLYKRRFPGVSVHVIESDESELVKLGLNSFFATKVAYFNELRAFSDRLGLDWDRVREGILSDGRIAHAHTMVPGPSGSRGFGGACLPKDLANLIDCIETTGGGISAPVMRAALSRNEEDRKR